MNVILITVKMKTTTNIITLISHLHYHDVDQYILSSSCSFITDECIEHILNFTFPILVIY